MEQGDGSPWEVFRVFLKLGVTSFGGPIAHLGYFRAEVVQRRGWITDAEYADLVALCQFLPGPASSKVGFGIGLHRAGPSGAIAAFAGFTLPSAVLMVGFAFGFGLFTGVIGSGVLTGLTVAAVAIVAQAVMGMARTLTPDRVRASIAIVGAVVALTLAGSGGQVAAISLGAVAGLLFCRSSAEAMPSMLRFPVRRRTGLICLIAFASMLLLLPVLDEVVHSGALTLFDAFFRAGSLVFGGGHVVLPLLQAGIVDPGWVSPEQFIAGYGAVQAVPGPLFTFAGYLGALSSMGPGGVAGAVIALVGIFLPGFLLLTGVLPFWNQVRSKLWAQALMRGSSASVVGILGAALYNPLFTTAITGPAPFGLALICFGLLMAWKLPPWVVVIVGAAGGVLIAAVS